MHSSTWKQFERDCAAFIGGKRYPANMGGPIDVEGPTCIGQCKKKTSMSHVDLAKQTQAIHSLGMAANKLGVVLHQVPRAKGAPATRMITMSWEMFDVWFSMKRGEL